MYWQEENDAEEAYQIPDDVFDVAFSLVGRQLAVDHAQSLAHALCSILPVATHSQIGIHQVRVAESGNGWERPSSSGDMLHLSRRTKLVLRVNRAVFEEISRLADTELDIDGQTLKLGAAAIRKLSPLTTLFSHGIACDEAQVETEFLGEIASVLERMKIDVKKMICGMSNSIRSDQGPVFTRALMVANLTPQESVLLQQIGIGEGRLIGCGLFLPHKGIEPVFSTQE